MTFAKYLLAALTLQFLISSSALSTDSLTAVHLLFNQNASGQQQLRLVIGDNRVATLDSDDQVLSIFDASSSKLYVLDHATASYRVSDVESVHKLAASIQLGMATLESKIASLPVSQQSIARQKLLGIFPHHAQKASEAQFVSRGKTGSFAGISCEWFDTLVDGNKAGQICATPPKQLPGGATLHSMLTSISNMYEAMEKADLGNIALPIPENPMSPVAKLGLIPIKMQESGATQASTVDVELVSVQQQMTKQSLLHLPTDYKPQTTP